MIHPDWTLCKHLLLKMINFIIQPSKCHINFQTALSSQNKAHLTQDLTVFGIDIECLKIQSEYFQSAILKFNLFNKNTLFCKRAITAAASTLDHITQFIILWLVQSDHVTSILDSDWSRVIMWPLYWTLIGVCTLDHVSQFIFHSVWFPSSSNNGIYTNCFQNQNLRVRERNFLGRNYFSTSKFY